MQRVLEYLRMSLFIGGALVGVQIPSFVDEYGLALKSRLQESDVSLSHFQLNADLYFDGQLKHLIEHYSASDDPVFSAGAVSLQENLSRREQLQLAEQEFSVSVQARYLHMLRSPLLEVVEDVWQAFRFQVSLTPEAIVFALVSGFLLALLLDSSAALLMFLILGLYRFSSRTKSKRLANHTFNLI